MIRRYEILKKSKVLTSNERIRTLFSWKADDYVKKLDKVTLQGLELAGLLMVSEIQKNLSGNRSGKTYGIWFEEGGKTLAFIKHRAASYEEFPAVLTGRLRSSISYATSESHKIKKFKKHTKYIKTLTKGRMAVYKITDKGIQESDFVTPPKRLPNIISLKIGTNVPYAKDLEFASPQKGGRPFMRRSFKQNWKKVKKIVYDTLKKSDL